MAGLVPAIHAAPIQLTLVFFKVALRATAWMPGTSPGMTSRARQ